MKKLKLILILLTVMIVSSCQYETPINYIVVREISHYNDTNCYYEGDLKYRPTPVIFSHWGTAVIDYCGKYQIGDTIKFCK
jgi:hypothetical protein